MYETNNAQCRNAYAGEVSGSLNGPRAPLTVEVIDALDKIGQALQPVRGNLADIHGRLFGFDSGDKESASLHPTTDSFESKLSVRLRGLLDLSNELSARSTTLASRI